MTILGIVLNVLLYNVAWLLVQASFAGAVSSRFSFSTVLIPEAYTWAFVASAVFLLTFSAAALIYIFTFYFSYFSPRPHTTGNRLISFLNGLFGGVIFAPLWNTCLAKRRRGISWGFATFVYLVDVVLYGYLLARFVLDFIL